MQTHYTHTYHIGVKVNWSVSLFSPNKRPLRLNYTLLALLGFGHFAWFKSGKMLKCHWSFIWMAFGPVGSFRVNGGGHKKMTSWPLQSSLSKSFFFCFRRKYDFTILFNKNDQNGSSKKLQLWLKMWNIPRFWVWSSAVCCDRADDVIFPSRCRYVMRRWAGHGDSVLPWSLHHVHWSSHQFFLFSDKPSSTIRLFARVGFYGFIVACEWLNLSDPNSMQLSEYLNVVS